MHFFYERSFAARKKTNVIFFFSRCNKKWWCNRIGQNHIEKGGEENRRIKKQNEEKFKKSKTNQKLFEDIEMS